jgi:hypothetical protein
MRHACVYGIYVPELPGVGCGGPQGKGVLKERIEFHKFGEEDVFLQYISYGIIS